MSFQHIKLVIWSIDSDIHRRTSRSLETLSETSPFCETDNHHLFILAKTKLPKAGWQRTKTGREKKMEMVVTFKLILLLLETLEIHMLLNPIPNDPSI